MVGPARRGLRVFRSPCIDLSPILDLHYIWSFVAWRTGLGFEEVSDLSRLFLCPGDFGPIFQGDLVVEFIGF
jgi:hypothetical protein